MPSKSNAAEIIAASTTAKEQAAQQKETDWLAKFGGVDKLDWKNLPPPLIAMLLTQIPWKGKKNEPDWYMTPIHALVYAMRCYELGVSPFSSEVFPIRDNFRANLTLEGKRKVSRNQGMNFGTPQFEWVKREWPTARAINGSDGKPIAAMEPGCTCKMSVGLNGRIEHVTYTAWLSEWHTGGGQWINRWGHMLQIRAQEKAITFASGAGVSEMPDDHETEVADELPAVEVPKQLKAPRPFLNPPKEEMKHE